MTSRTALAALIVAASISSALAQTPATGGGGSAGGATVGSDVKAAEQPRANREAGVTGGSAANEVPGMTPRSQTVGSVPNAAVSKPPADEAAPAGR